MEEEEWAEPLLREFLDNHPEITSWPLDRPDRVDSFVKQLGAAISEWAHDYSCGCL
jgi:hypothetical protein